MESIPYISLDLKIFFLSEQFKRLIFESGTFDPINRDSNLQEVVKIYFLTFGKFHIWERGRERERERFAYELFF